MAEKLTPPKEPTVPSQFAVYLKVIIGADNARVAENATVANMTEVPGEVYVEKVVTLRADVSEHSRVRAVVAKLYDAQFTEPAWVVATMSEGTYDVLDEEDWQEWKRKALDLALADWRGYEIREVWIDVPQDKLEELFTADAIKADVVPNG